MLRLCTVWRSSCFCAWAYPAAGGHPSTSADASASLPSSSLRPNQAHVAWGPVSCQITIINEQLSQICKPHSGSYIIILANRANTVSSQSKLLKGGFKHIVC